MQPIDKFDEIFNMPSDLISVIVPVYNVEKYLSRCIDSILAQTHKNLEIILVDDGSIDNCPNICDDYAKIDKRILVLHKKNGGLSSARNAGIDISKGNYIGFIDGDDYVLPDFCKNLYNALISAKADLSICNYKYVDEEGTTIDRRIKSPIKDETLTSDEAYERIVGYGYSYYVTAVNKLYKRNIFNNVRFPMGKLHEDEFTVHHIFSECNTITIISEVLYMYVQRSDSIMNKSFSVERLDGAWAFYDRFLFLEKKGHKSLAKKALKGSFSVALLGIRKLDVVVNKRSFSLLLRKLFPALIKYKFERGIILLLVYILKNIWIKFSSIKFKITFSFSYWLAKFKKRKIVFIVATPEHGNLGDQAIVYAERCFFEKLKYEIIEIGNNNYLRSRDWIQGKISTNDVLVIDGGGNLGTLWPAEDDKICDIIDRFPENKIIVFPQTCYYDDCNEGKLRLERNQKIYTKSKNLTIMLRDRASYEFAIQNFKTCKFIFAPDIVLSLPGIHLPKLREGVLLCFRKDKEQVFDSQIQDSIKLYLNKSGISFSDTSTVIRKGVNYLNRNLELRKKWNEFAASKLVITDRLHAMIFAAITGTPCLAIDNKSKKVGGTYDWIQDLKYIKYLENDEDVLNHIEKMYSIGHGNYNFIYPNYIMKALEN